MKNAANPEGQAALDSSKVGAAIVIHPRAEYQMHRALRRKINEAFRSPEDWRLVYRHREIMRPYLAQVVRL